MNTPIHKKPCCFCAYFAINRGDFFSFWTHQDFQNRHRRLALLGQSDAPVIHPDLETEDPAILVSQAMEKLPQKIVCTLLCPMDCTQAFGSVILKEPPSAGFPARWIALSTPLMAHNKGVCQRKSLSILRARVSFQSGFLVFNPTPFSVPSPLPRAM